jgi:hypothetical protein
MNHKYIAVLIFLIAGFSIRLHAQNSQWRPVSGERQDNLSGMALVEQTDNQTVFIIVNDNKKPEQNHVALVTVKGNEAPKYVPLKWIGDDFPTDLEAITSVPKTNNGFMALTAEGRVFHLELDIKNNSVKTLKSFDVPLIPKNHDFEGFAVQQIGDSILAVWADRGLDEKPAQLFWAEFDLKTYNFTSINSTFVKVPYPIGNTRHISDVKVDSSGAVFISSASDPGNNGPFSSAIYFAGTFGFCSPQKVTFAQPSALVRLFRFDYRKVEAIEFVPGKDGGIAFGTDDEKLGSAIYLNW